MPVRVSGDAKVHNRDSALPGRRRLDGHLRRPLALPGPPRGTPTAALPRVSPTKRLSEGRLPQEGGRMLPHCLRPSRCSSPLLPDLTFVSEYFSQSSQKLSFYTWYGNAKVFRFRVPEDTVLLRWLLQASRGRGPECGSTQVTFHIRHGAPPVINPLGTQFPTNTSVRLSYNQSLALATATQNSTFVNLTSPAPGDWFIAAHLPQATGKIGVKGFSAPCTYLFQPDMFVLRAADMAVLQPDVPMRQTLAWPTRLLHAKVFVPAYSALLRLELGNCVMNGSTACSVRVTLGSATLSRSSQEVLTCTGACSLRLASPPWEKWLQITVESLHGPNTSTSLEMAASFTACKPTGTGSFLSFYRSLNRSQETTLPGGKLNATLITGAGAHDALGQGHACLRSQPVIREDLDVVSVQFRVLDGSNVPVQAGSPTLLLLNLNSGMDSGGTLVLTLLLNRTLPELMDATVWACLSLASPVLSANATRDCSTAFFQGYLLNVTTSSTQASLAIPYPESGYWFLTLQLICPKNPGECEMANAQVAVLAYLSPCFDDCGTYGQCSLMRRQGYLYAGCTCKAGWSGWSCTDGTKGQSVGSQMLATLLLTLSNLFFLPAIAAALYHYHLVEASVYTFTMFFSTFYHACDQPGVVVLCIMDYDTVQFCDFLGSVVSIWVTILCMARVKKILKYVLCVLGTLFIALSLHLDRRGVWNMMGPCLVALIIMTTAWVYRGVNRRHCYPPSWKRWAFFLLPGISLALMAVLVYAFMETTENYYYTHTIWHILVASSVVFLLPPGNKHKKPWAWSRELLSRYQICKNDREELYAVT
ncbi:post-GPI attachment to proteins factor 6 isoform X1 [Varanus komodoensis]|uniref:post-GPI attachment to proteins factor 6 isoform X1 n=1 Tax=Varanus komodoensis TaxID=61221 RepID=UPI001CF7CE7D|nr:post-GPI attachment to proteins factor 6 isoform X1 [Varanus komodoensis]